MNVTPTDRPTFRLLNSIAGWQAALETNIVELADTGDLRLAGLPGIATKFFDGGTTFTCPSGASLDECGTLYVVDAATDRVSRVNAKTGEATLIAEIGGKGSQLRRFKTPRGIAALPNGGLAIADTNNNRVQIFSGAPYALTQIFSGYRKPWGIAYLDSDLYIADRDNGRIVRIRPDGTQQSEIGKGTLAAPTEIAVAPNETIAVVDASLAKVFLFDSTGAAQTLAGIDDPRGVAFDADSNLFVGTGKGLVLRFTPTDSGYAPIGAGVTGLDGAISFLILLDPTTLLAFIDETDVTPVRRLWTIATEGAFVTEGSFIGHALDSRIEDCVWHRVEVEGTVPDGSTLEIDTITSADPGKDSDFIASDFAGSSTAMLVGFDDPDGLVQNTPGRYLRLRITMKSDGRQSPQIHAIRVHFPRQSYLQYLPANFQEDDESRLFLARFLSIFQTTFDNFDATIDNVWKLFDPDSTPATDCDWLADWLALPVSPNWDIAKKREMLKGAAHQYHLRGTVAGLEQSILDYAGVQGRILEHYVLRRWPMLGSKALASTGQSISQYDARLCAATPLWSRAFNARQDVGVYSEIGSFQLTSSSEPLTDPFRWGASQFSVFFPVDAYDPKKSEDAVRAVVEREKPAHTQGFYVPVYARMRVGVQSSIGVDTYVSRLTYTVLNRNASLGYDAVLGASRLKRSVAALGESVPLHVGIDTRLL